MALRNAQPAATQTKPAFEAMEDEAGTTTTEENVTPETTRTADPAVAATTAIATASATSSLTVSKGQASAFAEEVKAMKGAADFTYGNYTVFKGNNGEIISSGEKQVSLGRWAKVAMSAWDEHWEVSPNSKSEKSRDYVAYSRDGVTIDYVIGKSLSAWAGKTVNEYMDFLREDWPDAKVARYIDIEVAILETDSNPDMVGEIVQVTLSKSSIPSFSSYQNKLEATARHVAKGTPGFSIPNDPFTFYFIRQLASGNGNNWTKLEVVSKLPAKI